MVAELWPHMHSIYDYTDKLEKENEELKRKLEINSRRLSYMRRRRTIQLNRYAILRQNPFKHH